MHLHYLIKGLLTGLALLPGVWLTAQNLVRNCDLESKTGCPSSHGQLAYCLHWYSPGGGTSDYLSSCNTGNFSVPANQFGNQAALSGESYAHIIVYYPPSGQYREYMQSELACALQEGKTYQVSFHVSCADDSRYAIDALGLHLSVEPLEQTTDEVIDIGGAGHITYNPGQVIDNKDDWLMISGLYTASGGERYITIGNFLSNGDVTAVAFPSWETNLSSYYIDDISVVSLTPIIDLGNDTTICPNDSILIDVSNICQNADLRWENGSTDLARWISEAGTYSLQGEIGCSNFSDAITISRSPDPGEFLPPDTVICPGKTIEITTDESFDSYLWQDGSNQPSFTVEEEGTYRLNVVNMYGCAFADTVNIYGLNTPMFDLGNDTLFCIGQALLLDPHTDSAFHHFLWSDNSENMTLLVKDSGYYWLQITNPCGELTDYIVVQTRNCSPSLAIPNAFTPNGDGKNDEFMIKAVNIVNFRMIIYDRWGTKIFETSELSKGWDGSIKGRTAPAGAYVWVAAYDILTDERSLETKKEKGSVMLIH